MTYITLFILFISSSYAQTFTLNDCDDTKMNGVNLKLSVNNKFFFIEIDGTETKFPKDSESIHRDRLPGDHQMITEKASSLSEICIEAYEDILSTNCVGTPELGSHSGRWSYKVDFNTMVFEKTYAKQLAQKVSWGYHCRLTNERSL